MLAIDETIRFSIQKRFSKIVVVISPPRCGSTVFSRVIWNHPSIEYYSHEPFEKAYYTENTLADSFQQVLSPLSSQEVNSPNNRSNGKDSLIIKEIAFQSASIFPVLASLSKCPIIFLIRDPRLSVHSKIAIKHKLGQNPFFPLFETGWEALLAQIDFCKQHGISYMIIDASDFRTHPKSIFKQVFEKIGLPFWDDVLTWEPSPKLKLDNFGGSHNAYYERVLRSKGIEAVTETIPAIEAFPIEGGIREHVITYLDAYNKLRQDKHLLRAETTVA